MHRSREEALQLLRERYPEVVESEDFNPEASAEAMNNTLHLLEVMDRQDEARYQRAANQAGRAGG